MKNKSLWKLANHQAKNIPAIHNKAVKDRQIALLCETLKKAMKGNS